MKVSKQFLRDFAYLANFYGWSPTDIEDIKTQTRASVELRDYWTRLAVAHRAGYQQTKTNGYERLQPWMQRTPEFSGQCARGGDA